MTIYARAHYQESVIKLPTTDKKQIKKILVAKQDALSHTATMLVGDVVNSGNQASVNSWVFTNTLPSAWVMLPETLLLAKSQNAYEVCDYQVGRVFYCALFSGLCYSGFKSPLVSSHERFAQSVGVGWSIYSLNGLQSTVLYFKG